MSQILLKTVIESVRTHGTVDLNGPFIAATGINSGSVYACYQDQGNGDYRMFQNPDVDVNSFTEVDCANRPAGPNVRATLWAAQTSSHVHVVTQAGRTDNSSNFPRYHSFDVRSNLWDVINEVIEDPGNKECDFNFIGAGLAIRADGEIVCMFCGQQDTVHGTNRLRVDYSIRSSNATWIPPVAIDEGGQIDYISGQPIVGSGNHVHFNYHTADAGNDRDCFQRTVNSANVLETHPTVPDSRYGTVKVAQQHSLSRRGVSFLNELGDTTVVCLPFWNSSAQPRLAVFDSKDVPGPIVTNCPADFPGDQDGFGGFTYVPSANELYIFYAVSGTVNEMFRDVSKGSSVSAWSTDVTQLSSDIVYVHAQYYERKGRGRIGLLFGVLGEEDYFGEYHIPVELELRDDLLPVDAGDLGIFAEGLGATEFPDQNSFLGPFVV